MYIKYFQYFTGHKMYFRNFMSIKGASLKSSFGICSLVCFGLVAHRFPFVLPIIVDSRPIKMCASETSLSHEAPVCIL